jgi:tetratricopeptide (TPR) repeat protein
LIVVLQSHGALVSNATEPNQYFTGRKSFLNQVQDYFQNKEVLVSLTGISGIGKTQIARKYAYDHYDEYKIIWVINCKRDILVQLQELAKNINDIICKDDHKCFINEHPKDGFEWLRTFINNQDNWLLIFDSFDNKKDYKIVEIFEDIKKNSKKNIIITSRSKEGLVNIIPIPPFSNEEAYLLTKKILRNKIRDDNKDQILQLINSLHHYPLALNKISNFLKKNNLISILELQIILAKNSKILNKFSTGNVSLCQSSSIEAILNMILSRMSKEIIELLLYTLLLDNHHLSKNFLFDIYSLNSSDKEMINIEFVNALWELNNNSLLEYKMRIKMTDESEVVIEMHDFLQEKLKNLIGQEKLNIKLKELLYKVENILPKNMNNFGDIQNKYSYIISNLEALLENVKSWDVNDVDVLRLKRRLLLIYSYNLDYKKLKSSFEWLEKSMQLFDFNNSEIRKIVAEFLVHYGQYCDFINDDSKSAINYYKRALEIISGTENENYEIFYEITTVIAQTLVDAGQLKAAKDQLKISEKILRKYPEISDKTFYYFVRSYVALAAGDIEQASLLFDRLELVSKNMPKDIFTAPIYILKAEILNLQSRPKEAYNTIKPICDMLEVKFANGHELLARALKELAVSELKLKMLEDSKKDINKAERLLLEHNKNFISEDITKRYSYDLGIFYQVKGDIFFTMKDYKNAHDYYTRALMIFQKRYSTFEVEKISCLLTALAKTEYLLGNQFAFRLYLKEHQEHFGLHHKRTKELLKISIN